MKRIRTCPFCGSTKVKIDSKSKNNNYTRTVYCTVSVRCTRCHARGGTASGEIPNRIAYPINIDLTKITNYEVLEERAIEMWNKRTSSENSWCE